MQLSKKQPVTLTLSDLAFGGMAVAKIKNPENDFVVFVDGGVPGDKVEVELTKIKKQYAVGKIRRQLEGSDLRIPARCKHFSVCGGCQWQFLPYEEQIKYKEKIVRDAVERIGGIANPPLLPIQSSPSPWFYRNKMEYTFSDRKRSDQEKDISLGLHEKGRFDKVFDLEECYLQSQFSVEVVDFVRKWATEKKLSAHDPRKNTGLLKNLIVREARSTGEFLVNLVTSNEPFLEKENFRDEILKAFPKITSLFHTIVTVRRGTPTKNEAICLFGKPMLTEIIQVSGNFRDREETLSLIFDIAPQAFFQPNSKGLETLIALLLALATPRPNDIVLDLYCGTGILGMFFAKLAKRVYGIEINESAIVSARQNAEKNSLPHMKFLCGDVTKELKKIPEKPTLVLVDPPRAGLMAKTIEHLLELETEKILYVSCNPTTLARDIKELAQKYTLKKVQPLDQFPQTYHVETICFLTAKAS